MKVKTDGGSAAVRSPLNQQEIQILQQFHDPFHKCAGHHAIHHPMICRQAEIHHGANHDLAVAHNGRVHNITYTQANSGWLMMGEEFRTP